MKIFSIILTTLFFFSFTSIASAEKVYTITNKSDGEVLVFSDDTPKDIPIGKLTESVDYFNLQPNECLQLTENQFHNLYAIYIESAAGKINKTICEDSECIEPDNYEIINYKTFFSKNSYKIKAVNRTYLSQTCKKLIINNS